MMSFLWCKEYTTMNYLLMMVIRGLRMAGM